jgi:chromosome segregation ATPase
VNSVLAISVQKLFLVAVVLKLTSSVLGWYLGFQWSLGFVLPLTVMAIYVVIGHKRIDSDVTDEKFADSCYYLGFIFTITSIVLSLLDLPQIGDRIQDISVRFGAAMVSTVFGLIVRVYLVTFRPDSSDGLKNAEDALLEASHRFREQLVMAYEKFGDFQRQVSTAAEETVENTKLQVERLSQDHSARMEQVFMEMNSRQEAAVNETLEQVKGATGRMSSEVDKYVGGLTAGIQGLETKVDAFASAVSQRLNNTVFPDDYFAKHLAEPVEQLKEASQEIAAHIKAAAGNASDASTVLAAAIRKLKTKANEAENSLDTVVKLTANQQALFDNSAAQLDELKRLSQAVEKVVQELEKATTTSASGAAVTADLNARVESVIQSVDGSQKTFVESMTQLGGLLDEGRKATGMLTEQIGHSDVSVKELVTIQKELSLTTQKVASELLAEREPWPVVERILLAVDRQSDSLAGAIANFELKATSLTERLVGANEHLRHASAVPSTTSHPSGVEFSGVANGLVSRPLEAGDAAVGEANDMPYRASQPLSPAWPRLSSANPDDVTKQA